MDLFTYLMAKHGNNTSVQGDFFSYMLGKGQSETNLIYGIKRSLTTSSSEWERTDSAVGLIANATQDGSTVQNDFDNIYPWSDVYTYNYDKITGLETAKIGDDNFKFDGTNGEVLTKIPQFYYKRWRDTNYEYIQISKKSINGFTKSKEFSIGRYDSSVINGIIHSYSGTEPEVNRNIASFRELSKAVGTNFGQLDWRYFIIQMLYLVEYADYNSQSKLGNGSTGFRSNSNDKALMSENNVNRILVANNVADYFEIGQQISIGTSSNGNFEVARCRTITSKEIYNDGDNSGTMIYFDGTSVNIAIGNVIWTSAQKNGICDGLGMKSGCYKTSKNACIYRGIENPFGNVYQIIDGINIKDYVSYICYEPEYYESNIFDNKYTALSYINANTTADWAKELGYDANNPLISLTTKTGGTNNTYVCDYYNSNSGNRIAMVGGDFVYSTQSGMWFWQLPYTSGRSYYNIGSRLIKY